MVTVSAPDGGEGSAGPDDVCGVCGIRLAAPGAFAARVRDSSALDDQDPGSDGLRTVRACSPGHLAEMISRYERRPFEEAELWAGKIARVLEANPAGTSITALAEQTGLDPSQIECAVMWQNTTYHRQHP